LFLRPKLFGDVETRGLIIDEGGLFEGRCRMGGDAKPAAAPSPLQPSA
jgi:cytoskeletal protein CcmA (bactofilin family)